MYTTGIFFMQQTKWSGRLWWLLCTLAVHCSDNGEFHSAPLEHHSNH